MISPDKQVQAISSAPSQPRPPRVASIDIFRGLTLLVMIFVNQLAEIKGLPWWTYHMPPTANGMTYVDMVFPFFLFIVGISIPFAIRHRLSKGDSVLALWVHVATRSLALIVLGLILANNSKGDPHLMGVSANTWTLLALIGAVVFWNSYPKTIRHRLLFAGLKIAGLVLLVAMLIIFRRSGSDGHTAWLDTSYWEILGIIGWVYFSVCLLYIPTRRWPWLQLAWFISLTGLNIIACAHWIPFIYRLPFYLWPFKSGAGASIVMAGVVTSLLLLTDAFAISRKQKMAVALCLSAVLFAVGWLTVPLGISKVRATPTWCLVSSGAAICVLVLLYWVCDVSKRVRWAATVRPAGSNTLLTYLLPPLCCAALGRQIVFAGWDLGWPGVIQAAGFTAGVLALAALLTRWGVRVQL
jgi:predicted acyltransferase